MEIKEHFQGNQGNFPGLFRGGSFLYGLEPMQVCPAGMESGSLRQDILTNVTDKCHGKMSRTNVHCHFKCPTNDILG